MLVIFDYVVCLFAQMLHFKFSLMHKYELNLKGFLKFQVHVSPQILSTSNVIDNFWKTELSEVSSPLFISFGVIMVLDYGLISHWKTNLSFKVLCTDKN